MCTCLRACTCAMQYAHVPFSVLWCSTGSPPAAGQLLASLQSAAAAAAASQLAPALLASEGCVLAATLQQTGRRMAEFL